MELARWYSALPEGINVNIADKFALLLTRGANVNERDSVRRNCLHIVLVGVEHKYCFGRQNELADARNELKDILMLVTTAGADIYAIDEFGKIPHDIAYEMGGLEIWHEVLDACFGKTQIHQDIRPCYGLYPVSENQGQEDSSRPRLVLSFQEYLEQRKSFRPAPEEVHNFDWESAESEMVQEMQEWDSESTDSDENGDGSSGNGCSDNDDSDNDCSGDHCDDESDDNGVRIE